MLDQFKILRVRSRDALDVKLKNNVWKLVAKLIGITYKSRMPSDFTNKTFHVTKFSSINHA